MNIQKKIAEIKTALGSGEVTQRDIDLIDCRASKNILSGKSVSEKVVDRLHAKLVSHREANKSSNIVLGLREAESICQKHGFFLTQRKAGKSGEIYFYAGKRIGSKQHWVYIGKELVDVETKVSQFKQQQKLDSSYLEKICQEMMERFDDVEKFIQQVRTVDIVPEHILEKLEDDLQEERKRFVRSVKNII